jgi:hypothetical protein
MHAAVYVRVTMLSFAILTGVIMLRASRAEAEAGRAAEAESIPG